MEKGAPKLAVGKQALIRIRKYDEAQSTLNVPNPCGDGTGSVLPIAADELKQDIMVDDGDDISEALTCGEGVNAITSAQVSGQVFSNAF